MLRQALRYWTARAALALTVIATLGLGIGASTAIFSVADGVLLRPLPWRDPDRLVAIWVVRPQVRANPAFSATWDRFPVSWDEFRSLQQYGRTLDAIAVWSRPGQAVLDGTRDIVRTMSVSAGFLPMLRVSPVAGRFFTGADDEVPSGSLIVSYETWQTRFGAATDIVGRRLTLDERSHTIVGVLPPRFRFDIADVDFLVPFGALPAGVRNNSTYLAVARLATGVTLTGAAADVEPILRGEQTPDRRTARIEPLAEQQLGPSRRPILLLLGAAALLLAIACANVAGLLIGDAQTRRTEVAVRQVLGASRLRIVGQMLVESLFLGACGGGLGIVATWWITPALVALAPRELPRIDTVAVNGRVLAFAVATTMVAALVSGSWPALAIARRSLAAASRDARLGSRGSALIVVGQVSLAVVLLTAATLLGESVMRLAAEPLGFAPDNLIVVRMRPSRSAVPDTAARSRLHTALLDRVRSLRGVTAAAATTAAPFGGNFGSQSVEAEGRPGENLTARRHAISDGYFATLRMPILRGRDFSPSDAGGVPIAIVSQELERRYFDGRALGRRLRVNQQWFTIVGIVPDHKLRRFDEDVLPAFFLFAPQVPAFGGDEMIVRAGVAADALIPALRDAVAATDPRIAIATIEPMETLMGATLATERYQAVLSSAFGGAALLLCAIGLYALLRRNVDERRREIGVRLAVGAVPADIVRAVMGEGARLVVAGLVPGSIAALAVGRVLRAQLHGVEPTDPHVFALTTAVLGIAACLATVIPALTASRTDPALVLRAH